MSDQDAYRRILASLSDAMLDDTHWPAASALIDEACGLTSNALLIGEGPKDDKRVLIVGFYSRGQRREEQEREYLGGLPSHRRTGAPGAAAARQPPGARHRPLHGRGVEDLTDLQRVPAPGRTPEQPDRAPGAVGGFPHHLGPGRSGGLRRLGVFPDRNDREAASPHPAVHPRPAGAGARRGAGHECDGPAGQPPDRRPPPGPARPDPGGQRPRPAASWGGETACRTGVECSVRGRPPTGAASRGWWPRRCRTRERLRPAGRCWSAAGSGHRRWW